MKRSDAAVLVEERDQEMLQSVQRGKGARSGLERHLGF